MLTVRDVESMPLDEIEAVEKRYRYEVHADRSYSVYRMNGLLCATWRPEATHVVQPTPDDGSAEWIERAARDACKMFYLIDVQQAEETNAPESLTAQSATVPTFKLSASTFTYHWPGCNLAGDNVLNLTLAQVAAAAGSKAKPCTKCAPPALPEGTTA